MSKDNPTFVEQFGFEYNEELSQEIIRRTMEIEREMIKADIERERKILFGE